MANHCRAASAKRQGAACQIQHARHTAGDGACHGNHRGGPGCWSENKWKGRHDTTLIERCPLLKSVAAADAASGFADGGRLPSRENLWLPRRLRGATSL